MCCVFFPISPLFTDLHNYHTMISDMTLFHTCIKTIFIFIVYLYIWFVYWSVHDSEISVILIGSFTKHSRIKLDLTILYLSSKLLSNSKIFKLISAVKITFDLSSRLLHKKNIFNAQLQNY